MLVSLKNNTLQALASPAAFQTAGKITTIPSIAKVPAQATFKHTGNVGFWYITLNRTVGPTTTNYSIKLGPGESRTEEQPPYGDIYALADSTVDTYLSWYVGWEQ